MSSDQPAVWNLVPPSCPPSAPALHSKAKNKPFALLRSLEPPRGPDFFLMERFRRRWNGSLPSAGSANADGLSRFARGKGCENDQIAVDAGEKASGSQGQAISQGSANSGLGRFSGSAEVSFSPGPRSTGSPSDPYSQGAVRSQASSSTATPQQGFSLFGGKAYATPGSYGRPQPSLAAASSMGNTSMSRTDSGGSGGLPRFKTLAQERQDEEREERERRRQILLSTGPNHPDRPTGSPSPPSPFLPPTPGGGSSPGEPFRLPFRTPSPVASLSTAAGARRESGAPPSASVGQKRLRAPFLGGGSARSATATARGGDTYIRRDPSPAPTGAGRGRSWGSLGNGSDGEQQQRKKERPMTSQTGVGRLRVLEQTGSRRPSQNPNNRASSSPRAISVRSPASSQPLVSPPPPRRYTLKDFAGADEVCFNPGASSQALTVFLERCEARGTVALSMLWADLTTSYSTVTVKSCLPSKQCFRWNCACGRQPRARQAVAPIVGAVVYLPPEGEGLTQGASQEGVPGIGGGDSQEVEFDEGETYLLPLGACDGENEEATEAGGYQLPLECESSYDERWSALAKLVALPVKKVTFNAQVALMPLIAWGRRPTSRARFAHLPRGGGGNAREGSPGTSEGAASRSVAGLFDPRVAAWMVDTGSTDKALEFEALCMSRFKPTEAGKESSASVGAGAGGGTGRAAGEASESDEGGDGSGSSTSVTDCKNKSTIVAAVLRSQECCRRSLALAAKLSDELKEANMLRACEQVEMPAIPVLAGMEVTGVVFLPERVTRFSAALGNLLEGLRRSAAAAAGGRDFNLASPDQVADVLFNHLELRSPPVKAGSTHASTSAEVLEGLLGKHPVVTTVLEFRGVNKYKTTYVDKLSEKAASAVPADCAVPAAKRGAGAVRIHAAWHQTSVRTGRLSCARPNLQQMPKSSDPLAGVAGVNVRDAFVASKGFTLMAADYSQIEMRVLADACKDPALSDLFASIGCNGGDIYRRLAAQVFQKEEGVISDHERTRAKVVCLGIIYGMGTPQVARKLEVTDSQAQGLVQSFLRAFPKIENFLAATKRYARERGYVCTLTGRRRNLSQINNAQSAALKAQAERQAVNSVVQGTAADIIKTSMVLVARRLDEWRSTLEDGLECPRLVMQIHDELVLECPACEEDLERLKGMLIECMEVQAPAMLGIKCPLAVNMLVGMSWGSMRKVVQNDAKA